MFFWSAVYINLASGKRSKMKNIALGIFMSQNETQSLHCS
jgi:hypothetical protein